MQGEGPRGGLVGPAGPGRPCLRTPRPRVHLWRRDDAESAGLVVVQRFCSTGRGTAGTSMASRSIPTWFWPARGPRSNCDQRADGSAPNSRAPVRAAGGPSVHSQDVAGLLAAIPPWWWGRLPPADHRLGEHSCLTDPARHATPSGVGAGGRGRRRPGGGLEGCSFLPVAGHHRSAHVRMNGPFRPMPSCLSPFTHRWHRRRRGGRQS